MEGKIRCPDPKWYRRLALGKVTPDQEKKLSGHLESCASCREVLEQLNDLSDFVGDTVGPEARTLVPDPGLNRLHEQLEQIKEKGLHSSAEDTSGFMDVTPWLDVSAEGKPGSIHEFELLELIGRGGMGVVFKCWDTKLERQVALKLMSPQLLVAEHASERFMREARSAARINHPNIVSVFGVGDAKGLPYLVMELVSGSSLETKLKRGLAFSEVLKISVQILAGLDAAHQQGVLHRDIKPANVILDEDSGQAKITDFGLACTADGNKLTRTGLLVGTPEYLAPEQAMGATATERSDLFSVGTVMYAMCQGGSPFSSSSMMTTLDRVRFKQLPSLHSLDNDVPPWFADVVTRLMDKDPTARFESAKAVMQAVEDRNTVPDMIEIDSSRAVETATANWARSGLLVGLTVGLLVCAVLYWNPIWSPRNPDEVRQLDEARQLNETRNQSRSEPLDSEETDLGHHFEVDSFEELVAAVESPAEKVTVSIVVDELQFEETLEIRDKDVVIRSAEGTCILFESEEEVAPLIDFQNGDLKFENVVVRIRPNDDEDDVDTPWIECCDANVSADRCNLHSLSRRPVIRLENCTGRFTRSCLVSVGPGFVWTSEESTNELTFSDSALLFKELILIEGTNDSTLEFHQSTLIGNVAIRLDWETLANRTLRLESNSSLLGLTESLILLDRLEDSKAKVQNRIGTALQFDGTINVLPNDLLFIENEDQDEEWTIRMPLGELPEGLENRWIDEGLFGELDLDELDWENYSENDLLNQIIEEYPGLGAPLESVFED